MKRKGNICAIYCYSNYGPTFGNYDINIGDHCNEKNSNSIDNNGTRGYEYHPEYKSSLFVNTNRPDKRNRFTVLDYEVFAYY